MKDICPKCGKPFLGKAHFNSPDSLGIIACVWHKENTRPTIFGDIQVIRSERCFLIESEWKQLNELL